MAYFNFLKYMRSLEEFRKNPHVKIPPKSPCANFQSLGIFKNQILYGKQFSSLSAQPAQQRVGPSRLLTQPRPTSSFLPDRPLPPPHWASVAAFFTGKRLQPRRLHPSLHPADGRARPIIHHLWLRSSTTAPPQRPAATLPPGPQ
jgi:hypothetical protein